VGLAVTPGSRALGLAVILDPRALNMGMAAKPCHESVIIK